MPHLHLDNIAQNDNLRGDVITQSVDHQLMIQPPGVAAAGHGLFGAEQAMLTDVGIPGVNHTTILPWMPDIAGGDWLNQHAVFVVGLAYAGFIDEYCGRTYSMPLAVYHALRHDEFGLMAAFMELVATPNDHAYYGKIEHFLDAAHVEGKSWCLLDLCRASMVLRRVINGRVFDDSRERNITRNAATRQRFEAYFAANTGWTRKRFELSAARHIVSLGRAAEAGVLRMFLADNWLQDPEVTPIHHPGFHPPVGDPQLALTPNWLLCNFGPKPRLWSVKGRLNGVNRVWTLIALAHPSARGVAWPNAMNLAAHYLAEHLV